MTIKELVNKYKIVTFTQNGKRMLRAFEFKAAERDGVIDELKLKKAEIIAYLDGIEQTKKAKAAARQAKIDAILGLREIEQKRDALNKYHYDFNRALENGDGLFPKRPDVDMPALLAKYPHAAAYLKAEKNAYSPNCEISAIGTKALEAVIDGDYKIAIKKMEEEIKEFADRHAWD